MQPQSQGRKARLSDVAEQAGVSEATVSRVLNGKPGVGAETRRAVLTALDVLGYERPAQLRTTSSGLVGLVVPELENPIFPAFAQAVESMLSQRGYTSVLCTQTPGGVTEDEYVAMLLARGVSGIVFISGLHADSTSDKARYRRLVDQGLPVVLVNGFTDEVVAPFISTDDTFAMRLAVNHLAALGHRRIGLAIGPTRYVVAQRKVDGFLAASQTLLGIGAADAEAMVERTLFTVEGGHAAATRLLDKGATAIVCGSDLMALGVVRAVRARGGQVPTDVSVVGFDDSPLISFTDPPLTTIRQPVAAMSQAAVQALAEAISGHDAPTGEYLFSPELIVRGSTAAAPGAR
ncbi:LacI family DNA-binding transcriptional regulator [Nocardioides pakistanensis]